MQQSDVKCSSAHVSDFKRILFLFISFKSIKSFSHRKLAEELDFKRPWLWCLVSFLFCFFPPLLTIPSVIQRMKIRKIKHIRGNILGDCCASCFCRCCVMAQNEHEMEPCDNILLV
ncbi:unnamed protein product [Oikopleura dioica]|uniref:Uncharacterized protein n=1 Tax=Oikopleura dioica TaxID=34765 RepID=E4WTA2_OIKDI|nr:unnamed protein product [Oikopleura dioica]